MNKTNKTFYIDTLGCAKNDYDSQVLAALLMQRGCTLTEAPEAADILIVNTCGFIESAKIESIEHIFSMASLKGKTKKLVVTGCLSERYHEDLVNEIPEVDIFTGVNDYDELPDLLLSDNKVMADSVKGRVGKVLPYKERVLPGKSYSGVLKIAEGCNNTCAFCAIPKIRGPFRSKKIEDAVKEAEVMAEQGIKELTIIAQDTSYYGKDLYGEAMLPELLRRLCRIHEIKWIRLLYVYDDGITDELIETIAANDKICNYLDIPIQHIADNVLSRMKRKSTGASIRETFRKLRANIPDVHIRTTMLVGFPGESEDDFKELMEFVKEARIDRLGVFAFSDEEGTLSYTMDDKLPEDVKETRRDSIMELQLSISEELNQAKLGKTYEVMIDEIHDGSYIGRTKYDAQEIDNEVSFVSERLHELGDIVNVKITEAYEYDLVGEEV
ncbi:MULTISPECIES: 30S ribosomal protein S12 methylthiotransferase RimO [Mogibacterium]|uniref:Ribosomal protein uS12 methylthiotransferase RimO n=2 Tax=Mogibacterium timidum TaxID=35519 RepID=X8IQ96_9FIRM|nr:MULTISPECIES: 30S ribosomal protein S12 methylthiotransferase RimO [Mogibacterium]EJU19268.1 ribosomal protein S12 methylthiotransferase RimO [Mogibacterium sp. CM50]EUC51807.1 ribosomal protein S12 methylthiotransferase RimO [Mogibacterium timidum ATCC 33093]NWO23985.1 30S ribosomal protein S12 methylthiotransferase RimO [Mogibacterium timidum]